MRFSRVAEHFDQLEATSKRNEMIAILAALFGKADNAIEIAQLAYLIQGRVAPTFEQVEFGMGEALVAEALPKRWTSHEPRSRRSLPASVTTGWSRRRCTQTRLLHPRARKSRRSSRR